MSSNGSELTGLWFEDSADATKHHKKQTESFFDLQQNDLKIFAQTALWLNKYFAGQNKLCDAPKFVLVNATPFRLDVLNIVSKIPYGKTITYGDIAKQLQKKYGIKKMSARAVGEAVGWNPICLIIPCHRVLGTDGKLTGYVGGLNNKIELLKLEKAIFN